MGWIDCSCFNRVKSIKIPISLTWMNLSVPSSLWNIIIMYDDICWKAVRGQWCSSRRSCLPAALLEVRSVLPCHSCLVGPFWLQHSKGGRSGGGVGFSRPWQLPVVESSALSPYFKLSPNLDAFFLLRDSVWYVWYIRLLFSPTIYQTFLQCPALSPGVFVT